MQKNSVILPTKYSGFSLIELMISAFIIGLGLLGLAGMQSMAVKSTVEIQQRTLANSLIHDITQRMQFNQLWLQGAGNNYAIASLAAASLAVPTCVDDVSAFSDCSGEDIKNYDLYEWQQKFSGANVNGENGLVAADACIAVESAPGSNGELVEVVISWFSTVKSKDAAADAALTDLSATCGALDENQYRRQISIETYVSKSS